MFIKIMKVKLIDISKSMYGPNNNFKLSYQNKLSGKKIKNFSAFYFDR